MGNSAFHSLEVEKDSPYKEARKNSSFTESILKRVFRTQYFLNPFLANVPILYPLQSTLKRKIF